MQTRHKRLKSTAAGFAAAALAFTSQGVLPAGVIGGLSVIAAADADVIIDETNFPDPVFRAYIAENCDSTVPADGMLNSAELSAVKKIDVSDKGVTDLTGIEHFTALTSLDADSNALTSVDLSNNTALEELYLSDNKLTELDLKGLTALKGVTCAKNSLTALDLSGNAALLLVNCNYNDITALDVSKNPKLDTLYCCNNKLTTLDVSKNTLLDALNCSNNMLTSLELGNTGLAKDGMFNGFSGNTYEIELTDGVFALSGLPGGFDASKASDWNGATYNNGTLKDFISDTVTYKYDCGRDIAETFTLTCKTVPDNEIAINAVTFPDESFRAVVSKLAGGSDKISESKLAAVKELDLNCTTLESDGLPPIASLKGIEYFTGLEALYLTGNDLTELDLSANTGLCELSVYKNKLTSLNVSKCPDLVYLEAGENDLTSIDITNNTALVDFGCLKNRLRSIDVSNNPLLETLSCESNMLTSIDISNNPKLYMVSFAFNKISSVDLSNNTALEDFNCHDNILTSLDVSGIAGLKYIYCYNNSLTSLDVSRNTALETICCYTNKLTALDVSKNTALKLLFCYRNELTELDVSKNTALEKLACNDNRLTALDLSNNIALTTLYCYRNELTELDVSKNTALGTLYTGDNLLTALDVSKNTALAVLGCSINKIGSLDVSANTALTTLSCYDNELTSLDVTKNTELAVLDFGSNRITSIDLSKNTKLVQIGGYENQLTSIDVGSTALTADNFVLGGNIYDIGEVTDTYDLSALPAGFDVNRTSDWTGAVVDKAANKLTGINSNKITYKYDCGKSLSETFTLACRSGSGYSCDKISDRTYSGNPKNPKVVVRNAAGDIVPESMYTVEYSDNINAGTAKVKITVNVEPVYIINETFKIEPISVSTLSVDDVEDQAFTGRPITPEPSFYSSAGRLVKDVDYTLEYRDNIAVGTATIVIACKGNYTGSKALEFNIVEVPAGDIVLTVGDTSEVCGSIAEAVKKIDAMKDPSLVCRIGVYNKVTEEKALKLPKKVKSLTIETNLGGAIRTAATSLSVGYDLTLDADIINTANKKISVKVGKGNTLTIAKAFDSLGSLSGTKTSTLIIAGREVTATDVKTFGAVRADGTGYLVVTGKMTGIGDLSVDLFLAAKASAAVDKVTAANVILTAGSKNAKTGFYELPKFTFGEFDETNKSAHFCVNVCDSNILQNHRVRYIGLPNSQPLIYTTGKKEYKTIESRNYLDIGSKNIILSLYGKEYRAEYANSVEIEGKGTYPSLEKALADMTDASGDYTLVMNIDITVPRLTLPKTLKSLTIKGNGHTLNVTGAVSLAIRYPLSLDGVTLKAVKDGKAQNITINAADGLDVEDSVLDGSSVTLKGKGMLVLYGYNGSITTISGFDIAILSGNVTVTKSITADRVYIRSDTVVTLDGKGATISAKKELSGDGGRVVLKNGFKSLSLPKEAAGITGMITLVPDGIASGTVVFTTKIAPDDLKNVFTVEGGELEAGKGGKISIKTA